MRFYLKVYSLFYYRPLELQAETKSILEMLTPSSVVGIAKREEMFLSVDKF